MPRKTAKKSIFADLMEGLSQSLAHARGELTLRTTVLPARPPAAAPRQVAALRKRLGMSQAFFAAFLNVSTKTVQSWEQGSRKPRAGDLRLLQLIASDPQRARRLVGIDAPRDRRSVRAA